MGAAGIESDIWSLGIITFECLVGRVPYDACLGGVVGIKKIKDKVLSHHETLPADLEKLIEKRKIKPTSAKFLASLICERAQRFTAEQCRRDPFFFRIDFSRLHLMQPP